MGLWAALRRGTSRLAGRAGSGGAWASDSISAAVSGFGAISGFGALDEELAQAIQPGEPTSNAPTIGWRRAVLVAVALAGCGLVFLLARQLAVAPSLPLEGRAGTHGELLVLGTAGEPARLAAPRTLVAVSARGLAPLPVDASLVHRSARWQVDDARRDRQLAQQTGLDERLATGSVTLHLRGDGARDESTLTLRAEERGFTGLGLTFWPLAALALC
ncbi:MAG: hypothetical protein U1F25_17145 [Rubrivivax sp.]